MSKTVLSKVKGFTPVMDVVVKATNSYMAALVFGRIWRYCQMEDGVCRASLKTIAKGINMSRTSIMNYAKLLVEQGFLEDLTPELRNKPHIYRDTGKASLEIEISAGEDNVKLVDSCVNLVDSCVNVAHLKKDINKDNEETYSGVVFKLFSNNIHPLTPMVAENLKYALEDYEEQWVIDAIKQAVKYNGRNWAYIDKVLKNWKAKGRSNGTPLNKMTEVDREHLKRGLRPVSEAKKEVGI